MICFLQKYCFKVLNLHTFSPRGPGLPKPPGGPWGPWNTEKIKDETALTCRQWSSSAGCHAHRRPTDERLTSAPLGPAGPRGPGGPGGPWRCTCLNQHLSLYDDNIQHSWFIRADDGYFWHSPEVQRLLSRPSHLEALANPAGQRGALLKGSNWAKLCDYTSSEMSVKLLQIWTLPKWFEN